MDRCILTADDSISIRRLLTTTLEGAGYQVLETVDGQDAKDKISPSIDMVITDLNMPNVDGLELIRSLRADPRYKFIPILMLTTDAQETKKQAGKDAGATGWIVKPFKPEQLLAVVRKLLG